jgi:hypothetical protein
LNTILVVKIAEEQMNDMYAPKAFYECPTYFHNGNGLYPAYMQGAGYFLPWWAIPCIYQESFKVHSIIANICNNITVFQCKWVGFSNSLLTNLIKLG